MAMLKIYIYFLLKNNLQTNEYNKTMPNGLHK